MGHRISKHEDGTRTVWLDVYACGCPVDGEDPSQFGNAHIALSNWEQKRCPDCQAHPERWEHHLHIVDAADITDSYTLACGHDAYLTGYAFKCATRPGWDYLECPDHADDQMERIALSINDFETEGDLPYVTDFMLLHRYRHAENVNQAEEECQGCAVCADTTAEQFAADPDAFLKARTIECPACVAERQQQAA